MGYFNDVVSSTWHSGSLIICVKKLKLKDLWPKAIFSHVLIEREREKCISCLIIFLLGQNDKIKQEKHNRILCLDTAQAELFTEMNNNYNNNNSNIGILQTLQTPVRLSILWSLISV